MPIPFFPEKVTYDDKVLKVLWKVLKKIVKIVKLLTLTFDDGGD